MADLEDALKKLDRLTQEEARMALAEMLRITHNVRDEVKIVDGKVGKVENKVDGVGDQVQSVDDKVQVIIDGERACSISCQAFLTSTTADGKQARVAAQETRFIIQQAAIDIDEIKCSRLANLAIVLSLCLIFLVGNQFMPRLRSWLSPADPSTNHNIARKVQHNGTAAWLFQGSIIVEWRATGSLLWIYGKRAFLLSSFRRATLTDSDYGSGLWEKRHLVCSASPPSCSNLLILH